MTDPARSDLRRDLELLDAAMLETVQRILAGEAVPAGPADRALCLLVSGRVLAVAETLPDLVARADTPLARLEAA